MSRRPTDSAIQKNKVLGKSSTTLLKIFSFTHLNTSICLQLSSYNLPDEELFCLFINLTNQKLRGRLVYGISGPAPKLRHQFFPSFRTQLVCTKRNNLKTSFIEVPKDPKKPPTIFSSSLLIVCNESERTYVVAELLVITLYFTCLNILNPHVCRDHPSHTHWVLHNIEYNICDFGKAG